MTGAVDDLPFVEADMLYHAPIPDRPRFYYYDPEPGETLENPAVEPRQVRIHDMRPLGAQIGFDSCGFALVAHPSAVSDFGDEAAVRGSYYPECEAFVAAATGARRVLAFDHVLRGWNREAAGGHVSLPALRVHIDHSFGTVGAGYVWRSMQSTRVKRLQELLGEEAAALLRGRTQVITLWRPIVGPLLDTPLALCDARSLAPEDLVLSDLVYSDRVAQSYVITHNPAHRWFYAPAMRTDEALLIRCADSSAEPWCQSTPHGAFKDATTPPDAPRRASIEVRMLVFHGA